MNKRIIYSAAAALAGIILLTIGFNGCKNKDDSAADITISPEAGTTYKSGDAVSFSVKYPASVKPDSVVYMLEAQRLGSVKDSSALTIKTDTLVLGARVITAKIYQAGKADEVTTNIVLLAAKAPEELTFKVEKVFPHDTATYTEGLLYQDGALYESGGGYLDPPPGQTKETQSRLKKVNLQTGKAERMIMIDPKVFAEGISIVGNKLIQLTYLEKKGFVYDKDTFKLLDTFDNNIGIEGWGMCFDGKKLYMDDKTNRIFFLDKDTYRQTGFIDVYDDKGAVNEVNELEMIDGKLYANVYQTDNILVIDPKTGAVLQKIDMKALYPEAQRNKNADVFNGIAYDKATGRIFVTGKKWDKLFQVKFVKK
ncbi:glutaminyl-peptide cyclotransferase [Mucilaginibacter psychrotolerans]|uniref:Glutaminyl-peptide cyclotransferase n=1 Tax=Mucilaginibacter psychrotolerans TaxID=1524096 RepID=A0A4Y8SHZ9_9SPHI|nr:glutaminyl-peptide cyclotransferase [Mucilaginibacter psychrotolerans]TFF38255.1 glutaminyl-peptide cyclotransferase [Mucilaginibacter psychrotolerans]